jgi:hypothetical protein
MRFGFDLWADGQPLGDWPQAAFSEVCPSISKQAAGIRGGRSFLRLLFFVMTRGPCNGESGIRPTWIRTGDD